MVGGVIKSTIQYDRVLMESFSKEQFRMQTMPRYYNGTLMYATLYADKDVGRRYDKGNLSVTVREVI